MSPRTIGLGDDLHAYLLRVGVRDSDILRRLRQETAKMTGAQMQIAPEQGQFMAFLVEATASRRILEIGTFTGYSTLSMATAMPPGGHIDACDLNPETTSVARRYWSEAGVSAMITLHLGPALDTIRSLRATGHDGQYDMIFVDADKENYDAYYEHGLQLVRPGGIMMFDNTLWSGSVVDPAKDDQATQAIRELNEKLNDDVRIALSLVPIGDGLTLARKR